MQKKSIENPAELVDYLRSLLSPRHGKPVQGGAAVAAMPKMPLERIALPKAPRKQSTLFSSLGAARFSLKDQVYFAKRLSFLINAGVPLVEGLSIMREQARGRSRTNMLQRVVDDVSSGQSLSRSFSKFPKVFSDFTVSIVRVGESSGTLSTSLSYLADELKKKQVLRRKLVGAFVYPAVISVATLGITAFLMLYLFPKIMPIFASLHTELPLSTRIVMGTSIFLQHYGLWAILGLIAVVIFCGFVLKRSHAVHKFFDRLMLRLPVVGNILQYYNIANATRTLGLLLRSGIKLSDALPITADTTRNLVYKGELQRLTAVVERGERMSVYLARRRGYFPDILSNMLAVGERSGSLSETLVYLSELYEHEVDEFTKNLSTLVEPALMIVMGLVVGFIAISIITPIYGITQNLHA